jgi:ribosome-associated translation inhibitor RaiA
MKFELRSQGVKVNDRLLQFVEKKLRFALGRFGHLVENVRVRLTDINGPKGGEDIQCQIRAHLGPAGVVTINETQTDPFAAVARASQRTGQNLSRRLSRLHAERRGQ